jgi:hypothetical protein
MANNLQLYHKTVLLLCQWLPSERITRLRNLALSGRSKIKPSVN